VHTLLGLSSIVLLALTCMVMLNLLRHINSWAQRRRVQLLTLLLPLLGLGLGLGGLHHFLGRPCLVSAPAWDAHMEVALPFVMLSLAGGAVLWGTIRLALLARVIRQRSLEADANLQQHVEELAKRLDIPHVRVRLCLLDRPIALMYGIKHPTLLLSTWMLEQLDQREFEAVLAHELEHVAQRDYLVGWLAAILRDAFFYLPTSWTAYHQLQHEQELACDDSVVQATRRPLALASALTKVWLHAVDGTPLQKTFARSLTGRNQAIDARIERLLATPPTLGREPAGSSRNVSQLINVVLLIALVGMEVLNITIMLHLMGCSPATLLSTFF